MIINNVSSQRCAKSNFVGNVGKDRWNPLKPKFYWRISRNRRGRHPLNGSINGKVIKNFLNEFKTTTKRNSPFLEHDQWKRGNVMPASSAINLNFHWDFLFVTYNFFTHTKFHIFMRSIGSLRNLFMIAFFLFLPSNLSYLIVGNQIPVIYLKLSSSRRYTQWHNGSVTSRLTEEACIGAEMFKIFEQMFNNQIKSP